MFTSIPIYFYPKLSDTSQKVHEVQQAICRVLHQDGRLLMVSLECGTKTSSPFLCLTHYPTLFNSISQADVCPHPLSHKSMRDSQWMRYRANSRVLCIQEVPFTSDEAGFHPRYLTCLVNYTECPKIHWEFLFFPERKSTIQNHLCYPNCQAKLAFQETWAIVEIFLGVEFHCR